MPLSSTHFEVVKIDRKFKDLAKLLKHAEEELFLDDAERDLLVIVYAFVVARGSYDR